MKKIFTILSITALAFVFVGCGKKTTKKVSSKDNTTTKIKSTGKTTKKTTTAVKTTTKDPKKEFKLVSAEEYLAAVDKIEAKRPYLKMNINGTANDFYEDKSATYNNEVLRLNSMGYFVGPDNSICGIDFLAHDYANHHGTDEKLYMNEYNEFMAERNVNISATKDATLVFTYDSNGYLTSVETKNIKTITGTSEYDEFYSMDLTIEYSKTDVIDGFNAITYDEFKEIAITNDLMDNPYQACIFNGSSKLLSTNETTTVTNTLMKRNSSGYYWSSEFSFGGMVSISALDFTDKEHTIYYKDNNNVLRSVSYEIQEDVYIIKDNTYAINNFVKKVKQTVYKAPSTITEPVYIYDFEVDYLENVPTVTLTLNAGYGKFSDNSKTKELVIEQNTIFNDFMNSATYVEPTLSGAITTRDKIYSVSGWFDENGCEISRGMYIKNNMTVTFGFLDSSVQSSPAFMSAFDINAAKESNATDKNVIKFSFDFDDNVLNASLIYDSQNYYYVTGKTFIHTYDLEKASASTLSIMMYSAFNKFALSDDKGPLTTGNNFLTYAQILAPKVNIIDHAFYKLTGIKSFTMPDSTNEHIVGSHAFDGCSSLESVTIFATTIKSYAFANSGLKGMLSATVFRGATVVEENVFYGCSNLDSILVEIALKTETLEDDSVVYYYDDECFTKPEGWASNWNCNKEIIFTPSWVGPH